jgi:hypothetical protein
MADQGVLFSVDAAQRTRDTVAEVERAVKGGRAGARRPPKLSPLVPWLGKTDDNGIPARNKTEPGRGTVTVYKIDDPEAEKPKLVKMTAADGKDLKLTVFNLAGDDVGKNVYVKAVWASGVWVVDWEDCSPDDEEDDEDPPPEGE